MKTLPVLALSTLALTGTASAQVWVQSIEQDLEVDDAAVMPNHDTLLLTSHPTTGSRRLEIYNAYGAAKGALRLDSSTGGYHGARVLESRADGTLLVAGTHQTRAWLANLDPNSGQVLWETHLVDVPDYGTYDCVAEGPGGIFAAGDISESSGFLDGFLVCHDTQGNVQWQRRIGPFDQDSEVRALAATDDGGVIAALRLTGFAAPDEVHVIKFSAAGTKEWAIQPSDVTAGSAHLAPSGDGNVLLARPYYDGSNWTIWVAKLTPAGSILWQTTTTTHGVISMVATADGGAAFLTFISGFYPGLLRIGPDGHALWYKKLHEGLFFDREGAVSATPEGGVMAAWSARGNPDTNYLARFDEAGTTTAACAGTQFFELGATTQVVNFPPTLSTIDVNLWFAPTVALATTITSETLTPQSFCGNTCEPIHYCDTAPNSVGAGARMKYNGTTSYFGNNFHLMATGLPANKPGLFFYASQATNKPFGNGNLCATGVKRRLPLQTSDASGVLTHDLDLQQPQASSITLGSTWYFQAWYRDGAGGGNGTNLTDGLVTVWCP